MNLELKTDFIEPANGAKLGFDTNFQNTFSYGIDYETTNFNNKQFSEKYETTLRLRTRYRVTDKLSLNQPQKLKVQMMKIKKAMTIFFGH